jgi:KDO2-lipid IV(A) lauroyltransferase
MMHAIVSRMPYRLAVCAGSVAGRAGYCLAGEARRMTLTHIALALPGASLHERRRIARGVFRNQGKNFFELLSFSRMNPQMIERLVEYDGRAALDQALREGQGVLLAGAHCGNWEIMGAALAQAGYPVNVIARRIYLDGLNDLLVGLRASQGVKVILRSGRDSARAMLRALRRNEIIGMLIDQDTDVPGVFVDFFGTPAWTPVGLAVLAVRAGVPVVLALDERLPDDRHRVILRGPLTITRTGDDTQDIAALTAQITALIEHHIRSHPSQWVWMHDRWKTRPSSERIA